MTGHSMTTVVLPFFINYLLSSLSTALSLSPSIWSQSHFKVGLLPSSTISHFNIWWIMERHLLLCCSFLLAFLFFLFVSVTSYECTMVINHAPGDKTLGPAPHIWNASVTAVLRVIYHPNNIRISGDCMVNGTALRYIGTNIYRP